MEKTRLAQAFDAEIAASHRTVIATLKAACAEVERRLEAAIAADPALARKREILVSIPGIAARIAGVVIADMPELGSLDRKAAASLAGLAPHPDQSGALPGRHTISGGRPCLRTAFYMAGMVAARCDPRLKAAYRAMREAGKPPRSPSLPRADVWSPSPTPSSARTSPSIGAGSPLDGEYSRHTRSICVPYHANRC